MNKTSETPVPGTLPAGVITVKEAARRLGLDPSAVRKMIGEGKFAAGYFAAARTLSAEAVDREVERRLELHAAGTPSEGRRGHPVSKPPAAAPSPAPEAPRDE